MRIESLGIEPAHASSLKTNETKWKFFVTYRCNVEGVFKIKTPVMFHFGVICFLNAFASFIPSVSIPIEFGMDGFNFKCPTIKLCRCCVSMAGIRFECHIKMKRVCVRWAGVMGNARYRI